MDSARRFDEFFLYPHCDRVPIQALTSYLSANGFSSLQCILVDMYSHNQSCNNFCPPGVNPVDICPLYDSEGYLRNFDPLTNTTWIKGGVRGRIYFEGAKQWPALNKTPLVLWRGYYAFLKSAHELWPPVLNGGVKSGRVSGVLLHFKFLASFSQKVAENSADTQHTEEWRAYLGKLDKQETEFRDGGH